MKSALLRHVDSDTLRQLADDDFDENGTLRDGSRFRVPMRMMDSAKPMIDGLVPAAHWGGWRLSESLLNDSKRQRDLERLYAQRDAEVSNAWKAPPTGEGSTPSTELRGHQPGDLCTVRGPEFPWAFGSPGHLDKNLVCVPDADPRQATDAKKRRKTQYRDPEGREEGTAEEEATDARSVKDARTRAYLDYDRDITTAWQKPNGDGGYRGSYNKSGQLVNDPPARRDTRSVADKVKDHSQRMAALYAERDRDLENAYKNK